MSREGRTSKGRTRWRAERPRGGAVYLLSNPSMPGLLKIGMTTRSVDRRVREINAATGVPTPYRVEAVVEALNAAAVEAATHRMLSRYRVNDRREFFRTDLNTALGAVRRAARRHNGSIRLRRRARLHLAALASAACVSLASLPVVHALHPGLCFPWLIACAVAALIGKPVALAELVTSLDGRGIGAHACALAAGGLSAAAIMRFL